METFIVGNLKGDVTPKQLYKALRLDTYPHQSRIELDLVVDKRGRSRGYAFLQIPGNWSRKIWKQDGLEISGKKISICYQEGNIHMFKDKRWVKRYKEDGMTSSTIPKPIYKYHINKSKPMIQSTLSQKLSDIIGPLCDMCADLTHRKFSSDPDKVVSQCYKLGVNTIVIPGQCHQQREQALDLIDQYSCYMDVYLSTGISPQYANEFTDQEKNEIASELKLSECRSIGPIGLDYKLANVTKEQQMHAFEGQLEMACIAKKPVYLVEHDAHDDVVSILTKYANNLPNCAIVDFTGTLEELKKYVEMGLFIVISCSYNYLRAFISPVITEALSKKLIPKYRILLASNSPRMLSEKFQDNMAYQYITSQNRDKLPSKLKGTEPVCVFLTLEIVSKTLGYGTRTEIRDFGKETVNNSKTFLRFNKVKKSTSNKTFVVFGLAVLILALMLEYCKDPEFSDR